MLFGLGGVSEEYALRAGKKNEINRNRR